MKTFKKILAVILSAVMLLTLFPLSVFANDPAPAPGMVVPGEKGTGLDGTVTVSLSASGLAAVLRSLDDEDALLDALKSMIRKEGSLITVEELLEIIPMDDFLNLILGTNREYLDELLDNLCHGDRRNLLDLIDDFDALVASVDSDALADFIAGIPNVVSVVNTGHALELTLGIDYQEAVNKGYLDEADLRARFSALSTAQKQSLFGTNYQTFINRITTALTTTDNSQKLSNGSGGYLTVTDLLSADGVSAETLNNAVKDVLNNDPSLLTAAVRGLLDENVSIPSTAYEIRTAMLSENADLRNGIIGKLQQNATTAILTEAGISAAAQRLSANDLNAMLDDNPAIITELVDRINAGTVDGDALLTQAGQDALEQRYIDMGRSPSDPLTAADFDFLRANASYYDRAAVATAVYDVTQDLSVDVSPYLGNISASDISAIFGTAANYNSANLKTAVLDVIDSIPDLTLADVADFNVPALLAADGVTDFFKNHITEYLTVSEIIDIMENNGGVDAYLRADVYTYASLVDLALEYVSVADLVELLAEGDIRNLLTGADKDATLRALLSDTDVISLSDVFDQIKQSANPLDYYVDVDAALDLDGLDFGALFDLFSEDEVVNQLKDNVGEIFAALSAERRRQAITFLIATVLEQFKKITVEGYTVAEENAGLLELDAEALIAAVWEVLPKLEELADENFDGTILSFNVTADYENADGTPVHKDVNFVLRVDSGIAAVRRVAALLDRYVSVEKNGNFVTVEINTPAVIADIYRNTLESGNTEAVAALRQKLLAMGGMTGVDLVDAFADISFSEIIAAWNDTDVNELWTRLVDQGYVERALEKFNEIAGTQYALSDVDTLDELLDLIREENLPTIQTIADKLSEKLGTDVMAALEKVAKVADENEYAQRLLEKAATLPGIGRFVDGVSAQDVLQTYKNMDPVKAVASFISDRVGQDLVSALYGEQTADELYHRALEFANAHLAGVYGRFQQLVVNLSDPDYESPNRFVRFIQTFLPASALSAFRSHSLTDVYRGNGEFSGSVENVSVDLDSATSRLFALLRRFVDIDADAETTLRSFLPTGTLDFRVALKFTFTDVFQVTYFDENGDKLLTAFLPKGTDPEVVDIPEVAGKEVKGWADAPADGNTVSAITGDANLYASYIEEKYNVTFKFYDGTAALTDLGTVEVVKGTPVAAAQLPVVAPPDNLVDGGYTAVWFRGEALDGSQKLDPTAVNVTEDVTYTLAYLPVGLVEDSEAVVYLTTDNAGNWVAQVLDATDFEVTVNAESPAFANAQSIAVESDTVSMVISPELLAAIKAGDPALSNLRLSSKRSDAPHEFTVASGVYSATSHEVYALDLVKNVSAGNPDGTPVGDFNGGLTVAIAPDPESLTVLASGSETRRTAAYIVENGVATESLATVTSTTDNSVSFTPPHFTDVVIVNEYLLSYEFEGTVTEGTLTANGTNVGNGILIPEGATVHNLQPGISPAAATANRIDSMTVGAANVAVGGNFSPMPSAPATVVVLTTAIEFEAFYRMPDGTLFAASEKANADAWLAAHPDSAPAGYKFTKDASGNYLFENESVDPALVQATVYRTPALTPVEYPIVFRPGHGAADINATFTVLDAENGTFIAPAMPEIPGFSAVMWEAYDLNAILAGTAPATVNGVYVNRLYTVTYANGSTAAFTAGTEINAETGYAVPDGYEIEKIVYVKEDGSETVVTGGKFVMPTSDVLIVVTERVKTTTVTVNGKEMTGSVGGVITFEIELAADETLVKVPEGARLVSFEVAPDGSRTLLYAVDVTEETPDLSYRVERRELDQKRVTDGVIGDARGKVDGKVVRYNTTSDTKFSSAVYSFAVYESQGRVASLLWLWILLIVVLVIAIIALLYLLIVRKGLGPNFFTRIIVAIVSVFFTMCLGVYALFSGEVFRKKNKKNK